MKFGLVLKRKLPFEDDSQEIFVSQYQNLFDTSLFYSENSFSFQDFFDLAKK